MADAAMDEAPDGQLEKTRHDIEAYSRELMSVAIECMDGTEPKFLASTQDSSTTAGMLGRTCRLRLQNLTGIEDIAAVITELRDFRDTADLILSSLASQPYSGESRTFDDAVEASKLASLITTEVWDLPPQVFELIQKLFELYRLALPRANKLVLCRAWLARKIHKQAHEYRQGLLPTQQARQAALVEMERREKTVAELPAVLREKMSELGNQLELAFGEDEELRPSIQKVVFAGEDQEPEDAKKAVREAVKTLTDTDTQKGLRSLFTSVSTVRNKLSAARAALADAHARLALADARLALEADTASRIRTESTNMDSSVVTDDVVQSLASAPWATVLLGPINPNKLKALLTDAALFREDVSREDYMPSYTSLLFPAAATVTTNPDEWCAVLDNSPAWKTVQRMTQKKRRAAMRHLISMLPPGVDRKKLRKNLPTMQATAPVMYREFLACVENLRREACEARAIRAIQAAQADPAQMWSTLDAAGEFGRALHELVAGAPAQATGLAPSMKRVALAMRVALGSLLAPGDLASNLPGTQAAYPSVMALLEEELAMLWKLGETPHAHRARRYLDRLADEEMDAGDIRMEEAVPAIGVSVEMDVRDERGKEASADKDTSSESEGEEDIEDEEELEEEALVRRMEEEENMEMHDSPGSSSDEEEEGDSEGREDSGSSSDEDETGEMRTTPPKRGGVSLAGSVLAEVVATLARKARGVHIGWFAQAVFEHVYEFRAEVASSLFMCKKYFCAKVTTAARYEKEGGTPKDAIAETHFILAALPHLSATVTAAFDGAVPDIVGKYVARQLAPIGTFPSPPSDNGLELVVSNRRLVRRPYVSGMEGAYSFYVPPYALEGITTPALTDAEDIDASLCAFDVVSALLLCATSPEREDQAVETLVSESCMKQNIAYVNRLLGLENMTAHDLQFAIGQCKYGTRSALEFLTSFATEVSAVRSLMPHLSGAVMWSYRDGLEFLLAEPTLDENQARGGLAPWEFAALDVSRGQNGGVRVTGPVAHKCTNIPPYVLLEQTSKRQMKVHSWEALQPTQENLFPVEVYIKDFVTGAADRAPGAGRRDTDRVRVIAALPGTTITFHVFDRTTNEREDGVVSVTETMKHVTARIVSVGSCSRHGFATIHVDAMPENDQAELFMDVVLLSLSTPDDSSLQIKNDTIVYPVARVTDAWNVSRAYLIGDALGSVLVDMEKQGSGLLACSARLRGGEKTLDALLETIEVVEYRKGALRAFSRDCATEGDDLPELSTRAGPLRVLQALYAHTGTKIRVAELPEMHMFFHPDEVSNLPDDCAHVSGPVTQAAPGGDLLPIKCTFSRASARDLAHACNALHTLHIMGERDPPAAAPPVDMQVQGRTNGLTAVSSSLKALLLATFANEDSPSMRTAALAALFEVMVSNCIQSDVSDVNKDLFAALGVGASFTSAPVAVVRNDVTEAARAERESAKPAATAVIQILAEKLEATRLDERRLCEQILRQLANKIGEVAETHFIPTLPPFLRSAQTTGLYATAADRAMRDVVPEAHDNAFSGKVEQAPGLGVDFVVDLISAAHARGLTQVAGGDVFIDIVALTPKTLTGCVDIGSHDVLLEVLRLELTDLYASEEAKLDVLMESRMSQGVPKVDSAPSPGSVAAMEDSVTNDTTETGKKAALWPKLLSDIGASHYTELRKAFIHGAQELARAVSNALTTALNSVQAPEGETNTGKDAFSWVLSVFRELPTLARDAAAEGNGDEDGGFSPSYIQWIVSRLQSGGLPPLLAKLVQTIPGLDNMQLPRRASALAFISVACAACVELPPSLVDEVGEYFDRMWAGSSDASLEDQVTYTGLLQPLFSQVNKNISGEFVAAYGDVMFACNTARPTAPPQYQTELTKQMTADVLQELAGILLQKKKEMTKSLKKKQVPEDSISKYKQGVLECAKIAALLIESAKRFTQSPSLPALASDPLLAFTDFTLNTCKYRIDTALSAAYRVVVNRPSAEWTDMFEYMHVRIDPATGEVGDQNRRFLPVPRRVVYSIECITRVRAACTFKTDFYPPLCSPRGVAEEVVLMCVPLLKDSHSIYAARVEKALADATSISAVVCKLASEEKELVAAHRAHTISMDSNKTALVPSELAPYTILADRFVSNICDTPDRSVLSGTHAGKADTMSDSEMRACERLFVCRDQPSLRIPPPRVLCATALEAIVDSAATIQGLEFDAGEWTREVVCRVNAAIHGQFETSPELLCTETICNAFSSATARAGTFRIVPLTAYSAADVLAAFADRGLYSSLSQTSKAALQVAMGTVLVRLFLVAPDIFKTKTREQQLNGLATIKGLDLYTQKMFETLRRAIAKFPEKTDISKDVVAVVYASVREKIEERKSLETIKLALGIEHSLVLHIVPNTDSERPRVLLRESLEIARYTALRQTSPESAGKTILRPLLKKLALPEGITLGDLTSKTADGTSRVEGDAAREMSACGILHAALMGWADDWNERPREVTNILYTLAICVASRSSPIATTTITEVEHVQTRDEKVSAIAAVVARLGAKKGYELLNAVRACMPQCENVISTADPDIALRLLTLLVRAVREITVEELVQTRPKKRPATDEEEQQGETPSRGQEKRSNEPNASVPVEDDPDIVAVVPFVNELRVRQESLSDEIDMYTLFRFICHLKFTWSMDNTGTAELAEKKQRILTALRLIQSGRGSEVRKAVPAVLAGESAVTVEFLTDILSELPPCIGTWLAIQALKCVKGQDPLEYSNRWARAKKKRSAEDAYETKKGAYKVLGDALTAPQLSELCRRQTGGSVITAGDMSTEFDALIDYMAPGMRLAPPMKADPKTLLAYGRMRLAWDLLSVFHRCMNAELRKHHALVCVLAASTNSRSEVDRKEAGLLKRSIGTLIKNVAADEFKFSGSTVPPSITSAYLKIHVKEAREGLPVRALQLFEVFERMVGVKSTLHAPAPTDTVDGTKGYLAPIITSICQNSHDNGSALRAVYNMKDLADAGMAEKSDGTRALVDLVQQYSKNSTTLPELYAKVMTAAAIKATNIGRDLWTRLPGKARHVVQNDEEEGPPTNKKQTKFGAKKITCA